VWVAAGKDIVRFAPDGEETGRKKLHFAADDIAFGEGFLWATHPGGDLVTKLDPEDLANAVSIPTSDGPTDVETGEGYAWVTSPSTGHVIRIDPRSNGTTDIDIVNSPLGLAVGDEVWVAVGSR
jgi:sugar lactone lactonase YvrE